MYEVPEAYGADRARSKPTRMRPQDGDVVVERESKFPMTFVIRPVPHAAPLAASARDPALGLARRLAAEKSVDLWYYEHGGYRLLEMYRADRQGPPAS